METPLFYVETDKCTLCFACIRNCPVKAIDVKELTRMGGHLSPIDVLDAEICYHKLSGKRHSVSTDYRRGFIYFI